MEIMIRNVVMSRTDEDGWLGKVEFAVKDHKEPYEIVFHSKDGRDWGYSLHFLDESGPEEEIDALDQYLEENDEAYEMLLDAALQAAR
jgi:predicted RNase H-like HicB family nuclease